MRWYLYLLCCTAWINWAGHHAPNGTISTQKGRVSVRSDAPLELITASSQQLRGIIDPAKNTFAWSVEVKTFEGFNSPLQREHFNENYLESNKYPKATFSGKIIEKVDFQRDGVYTVRAKGTFTIHGVAQERIIKSQITIKKGAARIQSAFTVPLADHQIEIPRVVYQKIAEEITVNVDAELR
jgi:YceI-like domain